ncbi:MAG: hypothetical protein QW660_08735 [Candidatus Bathyarchaeia archaeon]
MMRELLEREEEFWRERRLRELREWEERRRMVERVVGRRRVEEVVGRVVVDGLLRRQRVERGA